MAKKTVDHPAAMEWNGRKKVGYEKRLCGEPTEHRVTEWPQAVRKKNLTLSNTAARASERSE